MRLRGRPRRRPDHWSSPHERARVRAAERLAAPLQADEETWLEAHLTECRPCRLIAAAYATDQLAIRLLGEDAPHPPRDLWARTAAGIEHESMARRLPRRRGPRRPAASLPALGALSGIAVVALVVVTTAVSGGWFGEVGQVAVAPTATPAVASPGESPAATALAVAAEEVHWLGAAENGTFAYNVADIRAVCQKDRQPDCAPFADENARRVTLIATPRFMFQSPIDDQAIVVGTDASGADAVLVVSLPASDPAPLQAASAAPDASGTPADSPIASPGVTDAVGSTDAPNLTAATSDEPVLTVEPVLTDEPVPSDPSTPTEVPIGTDAPILAPVEVPAATLASGEPVPSELSGPEPSPGAIAIITDVVVVGRSASYSPDGAWFAFSARPSDGSAGPDIYVWHVGDLQARALTTDHSSVFASWVGGIVLGSRLSPDQVDAAEPTGSIPPGDPGASAATDGQPAGSAAIPTPATSTPPSPTQPVPTADASSPVDGAALPDASALLEPTPIRERMPQTFLIDPWTGTELPLAAAEWQPAVAPGGLVVVAWQGTVGLGPDGITAAPLTGNLVVHPFHGPGEDAFAPASPGLSPGSSESIDASVLPSLLASISPTLLPTAVVSLSPLPPASASPPTDAPASPLPEVLHDFPAQVVAAGPIADFDARWDDTGSWLALWIADPLDPGLGRLSLLHFDPFTGIVDRPPGAPQDVTALPGFSIGFGRLAWVSPPGQGGEGSRIQIAAWTANEVGAIESIPVEGAIVIQ